MRRVRLGGSDRRRGLVQHAMTLAPKGPEAIKEWLGELRGPPKGRTK